MTITSLHIHVCLTFPLAHTFPFCLPTTLPSPTSPNNSSPLVCWSSLLHHLGLVFFSFVRTHGYSPWQYVVVHVPRSSSTDSRVSFSSSFDTTLPTPSVAKSADGFRAAPIENVCLKVVISPCIFVCALRVCDAMVLYAMYSKVHNALSHVMVGISSHSVSTPKTRREPWIYSKNNKDTYNRVDGMESIWNLATKTSVCGGYQAILATMDYRTHIHISFWNSMKSKRDSVDLHSGRSSR